ncbi:hypothetical protein B9Y75_03635 [Stenotrophomonas maltophilia]|nr:hypothetical protein B9Y75_03635 [Stenotrophomonas maltophilia]
MVQWIKKMVQWIKHLGEAMLHKQRSEHPGLDLTFLASAIVIAILTVVGVSLAYRSELFGPSPDFYLAGLGIGLIVVQALIGACRSLKWHLFWLLFSAGGSLFFVGASVLLSYLKE